MIAGLILAAGASTRMGANKLLAELDGRPLAAHALDAARGAGLSPILAVTAEPSVDHVLAGAVLLRNPAPGRGLSSSLRLGLAALPAEAAGVVVLLGDMPRVTAAHVSRLVEAFHPGTAACVPTYQGRRGNPVLLGRALFGRVMALQGDQGARRLLESEEVVEVAMADAGILADVDVPADLERLR